ncbi:PspA/IM30 family protein [Oceanobacillus sp. CAU 1775]
MGILSRFTNLMRANINSVIDRAKDPEKAIKETIREVNLNLRTLQSENNALKADAKRAKRELDECNENINKFQRFSEKAAENGDDLKAQAFLDEKQEHEDKKQKLLATYNNLAIEVKQMQLLEDKLAMDVAQLETRAATILDKSAELEKQSLMNNAFRSSSNSGFSSYEEELNFKLDEAEALAELRNNVVHSEHELSIDEEIAKLNTKKE